MSGTISRHPKQHGGTASSKVTDRPALAERVLQMYADGMRAKDIASKIGIRPKSASKILHGSGVSASGTAWSTRRTNSYLSHHLSQIVSCL